MVEECDHVYEWLEEPAMYDDGSYSRCLEWVRACLNCDYSPDRRIP